jgi:hypothetical protein
VPAAAQIRIKGKAELEAAFMQLRRDVFVGLRPALVAVAEKVKTEAHAQAPSGISNIEDGTGNWSYFRLGTSAARQSVFVAPKARRSGGSPRPNLGGLLLVVMQRALDAHQEEIGLELTAMIDAAEAKAGL